MHVQDQRGFFIMYDAALRDFKSVLLFKSKNVNSLNEILKDELLFGNLFF